MATTFDKEEVRKILRKIRKLKYDFVKLQEYQSASMMRDLEKKYMDKKVKITDWNTYFKNFLQMSAWKQWAISLKP